MMTRRNFGLNSILLASVAWTAALVWTASASSSSIAGTARAVPAAAPTQQGGAQAPPVPPVKASMETSDEAVAASAGCITCHTKTDEATMHPSGTVTLGCATCHGGDPAVSVAAGLDMDAKEYRDAKRKAHPQPRVSDMW